MASSAENRRNVTKYRVLAVVLACLLVVTAICNGAGSFLRRTGLIDSERYAGYWAVHCGPLEPPREWQCAKFATAAEISRHREPSGLPDTDRFRYIFEVGPAERPLKFAKDLFVLLVVGVSLVLLRHLRGRWPTPQTVAPLLLFACSVGFAFAASVFSQGMLVAGAGARSFMFVAVAFFAEWAARHLDAVARAIAVLLGAQIAIAPIELVRGAHLFMEWGPWDFASRLAGTFVHPNSLGVFAACGAAFYYCFMPGRRHMPWVAACALALIALSGSGTGFACAAFVAAALIVSRVTPERRLWVGAVAGVASGLVIFLLLPSLSGRSDVFDSLLLGRLAVLRSAVVDANWVQLVFGHGLGVNTNTALTLSAVDGRVAATLLPTDSLLTGLLIQTGLVGCLLFYVTLVWAGMRDRTASPFYAVIALCSLTANVTELFPLNALLGLAWAHSLWHPEPVRRVLP